MKLSYNRHGRLDFDNGVLDIEVGDHGVEHAAIYCEPLDIMVDCTNEIIVSAKWCDKAIEDYCQLEERRHG